MRGKNSERKSKESKVERFAKDDWVIIPKGVKSVGIMQKKMYFDEDVEGQIVTYDEVGKYFLVELHDKHLLVDYSLESLKKKEDSSESSKEKGDYKGN